MLPDDTPDSGVSESAAVGSVRSDAGASPAAAVDNLADDDAYDLVYRATRDALWDALWDVLGTATLILFYLALVGIGLAVAVGGIGPFLRESMSLTAFVVGVVALAVAVFAAVRVYRLVTE